MSNQTSIQMTEENSEELLAAAKAASNDADGVSDDDESNKDDSDDDEGKQDDDDGDSNDDSDKDSKDDDDLKIKGSKDDDDKDEKKDDVVAELDMDAYYDEFTKEGKLSEESNTKIVDALKGAGFKNPEALLQNYFAGEASQIAGLRTNAFEAAGDEATYRAAIAWAGENLSQAEQDAFDDAVDNPAMVKMAVQGLTAQFKAAGGIVADSTPQTKRVNTGGNVHKGLAPIRSRQQLSELTGDKRYHEDPGFRQEVEDRLKASQDAGMYKP